ncbi:nucleoside deaminase [Phenylobacterium sp. NIBR 498073]|uniref:nucleoside deaminase n=1 Tax=Phenylobacterium sp. NIBR 498073 TaxID=3015177 RepID=UPI0022B46240|nr:nucleoside deaminase [Phenylobacterium sp. NIBR 498073]WGU38631.1 nucleoside deaminase [Phenylobacterium sp. NIBR 498073]
MPTEADFMAQAVDLATANVLDSGGRPFGAVVVKDGEVIATGVNEIGATGDPTAHAELTAMRRAAQALGVPRLDGCMIYASGQPCPMCLAAMHMTGVAAVRFCYSNDEAEAFGLSTARVYAQMAKPLDAQAIDIRQQAVPRDGPSLYAVWKSRQDD